MIVNKHHFEYMTWKELAEDSLDPIILRFYFATLLIIGTVTSWLSPLIGCFIYLSFKIFGVSTDAYYSYKGTSDRIYHDDDYEEPNFLQKRLIYLGKTNK